MKSGEPTRALRYEHAYRCCAASRFCAESGAQKGSRRISALQQRGDGGGTRKSACEGPHFAKYASIDARAAFIDLIRRNAQMHVVTDLDLAEPYATLSRSQRPISWLALAVAANADTIVSSDQGSAGAASLARVAIMTPAQFGRAICSLRIFPYEYFPSASTLY